MEEFHLAEPHWYLPLIAADPARQGQGLGTALMEAAIARIDADGRPAYLESSNPRNIPLYERFGFERIGEIQDRNLAGADADGPAGTDVTPVACLAWRRVD